MLFLGGGVTAAAFLANSMGGDAPPPENPPEPVSTPTPHIQDPNDIVPDGDVALPQTHIVKPVPKGKVALPRKVDQPVHSKGEVAPVNYPNPAGGMMAPPPAKDCAAE